MDQVLASASIDAERSIHIATLSRATIEAAGAEHMGFDGYFLFESCDSQAAKGIEILAKAASIESALRLIEIWRSLGQAA